jgi:hypothetical protein
MGNVTSSRAEYTQFRGKSKEGAEKIFGGTGLYDRLFRPGDVNRQGVSAEILIRRAVLVIFGISEGGVLIWEISQCEQSHSQRAFATSMASSRFNP